MVSWSLSTIYQLKDILGLKFTQKLVSVFEETVYHHKVLDIFNERIKALQNKMFEDSFLSTAADPNFQHWNSRIVLRIEVEKDTLGGVVLRGDSASKSEKKILFEPSSSLLMKHIDLTQDESDDFCYSHQHKK